MFDSRLSEDMKCVPYSCETGDGAACKICQMQGLRTSCFSLCDFSGGWRDAVECKVSTCTCQAVSGPDMGFLDHWTFDSIDIGMRYCWMIRKQLFAHAQLRVCQDWGRPLFDL